MKMLLMVFTVLILNQNVFATGSTHDDPYADMPETSNGVIVQTQAGYVPPTGAGSSAQNTQKFCPTCAANHQGDSILGDVWNNEKASPGTVQKSSTPAENANGTK